MATELGQAYVQIMPSARGISGSVSGLLGPEANAAGMSAGGKFGSALKLAAVGAVAAAAIGKALSASITAGGELQQSLGGIETLFKGSADKVKQYASEAYKTSGLSANEYMQSVTGFSASLLQSLGGDTEKAADVANTALTDMSDNANKMGTSMESIQMAYQGFAKQNYTMLDNLKLGYGGTKGEMERLLADAQKLTGQKYDINNLSDVYSAIHAVQTELGITGTTAKEASSTLQGSFASMKASFTDVLGGLALGTDITPQLQALAQTASTFLFGNLLPMVGNVLSALPGAVVTFVQAAVPMIIQAGSDLVTNLGSGVLSNIPTLVENGGTMLISFLDTILTKLPDIIESGKNMLLSLINGIVTNLPGLLSTAITLMENFLSTVLTKLPDIVKAGVDLIVSLIGGILSNLPELITSAVTLMGKFIGMIISKLPEILSAGVQIVGSILSGIGQVASNLTAKADELMQGIKDKIAEWAGRFLEAGKNIVDSIAAGISSGVGKVKDAIGGVVQAVRDFLPFSPAKVGPLKDLNRLNFGGTISESILNAKGPVTAAMNELSKATIGSYEVGAAMNIAPINAKKMSPSDSATKAVEGAVSALAALFPQAQSGTYAFNLYLPDGTKLAASLIDPLKDEARRRGVSLA